MTEKQMLHLIQIETGHWFWCPDYEFLTTPDICNGKKIMAKDSYPKCQTCTRSTQERKPRAPRKTKQAPEPETVE